MYSKQLGEQKQSSPDHQELKMQQLLTQAWAPYPWILVVDSERIAVYKELLELTKAAK